MEAKPVKRALSKKEAFFEFLFLLLTPDPTERPESEPSHQNKEVMFFAPLLTTFVLTTVMGVVGVIAGLYLQPGLQNGTLLIAAAITFVPSAGMLLCAQRRGYSKLAIVMGCALGVLIPFAFLALIVAGSGIFH